jgi:hypothetical protein
MPPAKIFFNFFSAKYYLSPCPNPAAPTDRRISAFLPALAVEGI